MKNQIIREEICFHCDHVVVGMEYEPWNHSALIPITIINGRVVNTTAVCHKCFNILGPKYTVTGWLYTVPTKTDILHGAAQFEDVAKNVQGVR